MADRVEVLINPELQMSDAEYDAWCLKETEDAMREADDPNTIMIPHEEVMRELHELRKQWRSQAAQPGVDSAGQAQTL